MELSSLIMLGQPVREHGDFSAAHGQFPASTRLGQLAFSSSTVAAISSSCSILVRA
jgi:hypothetical protein